MSTSNYNDNFAAVLAAEQSHIGITKESKTHGLAFSGGGIRSASFALGFMQALVAHDKLKKFDYLSTVSGGGFIGSALTWFLTQKIPPWMSGQDAGEQYFSTSPEHFPFGQTPESGGSNPKQHHHNAILNFIRQHGNYLLPGQGLNGIALFGYVLRAMIVSLSVYLALLTAFMVVFIQCGFYRAVPTEMIPPGLGLVGINWFFYISFLFALVFLLISFAYSFMTRFSAVPARWVYETRTYIQKHAGWVLATVFFLVLLGSVGVVHKKLEDLASAHMHMSAAGMSTLFGIIGALIQLHRSSLGETKNQSWVLVLASSFVIYGIVSLAYYFGELIVDSHEPTWWVTGVMLITMLVVSTCVNINILGLHRMYRDRLMETFQPNLENVRNRTWGLATEADVCALDSVCQINRRPYHLINTNIVLVDSSRNKYNGRGGDSFTLSPLYCGSEATGWMASKEYMHGGGRSGLTLPTAMAISGAAVNPDTGVDGSGLTRDRIVSTLLALLNLRLGFWASNPNPKYRSRLPVPPNFLFPGLKGGVLGGDLREDRRAIQLSDGGHFENLGVYELVRRQLDVIVVTDGGADPQFNFGDLANVVEKVRVDFGADIVFDQQDFSLDNMVPGSGSEKGIAGKYPTAKNPCAVAAIHYANGKRGLLLYVKATLIANLPADLVGYKTANETFPDQSTLDQFFDERQFEAYRELGYCLGQELLKHNQQTAWL